MDKNRSEVRIVGKIEIKKKQILGYQTREKILGCFELLHKLIRHKIIIYRYIYLMNEYVAFLFDINGLDGVIIVKTVNLYVQANCTECQMQILPVRIMHSIFFIVPNTNIERVKGFYDIPGMKSTCVASAQLARHHAKIWNTLAMVYRKLQFTKWK